MSRALLVVALLALATPAAAQFRHRPAGPPPGEHPEGPREHLFISPAGEPFRGEGGLAAWFAGADADHDGALTAAEFGADAMRWFRVLDTNGDSRLDGFEIQAYERERVPEITALAFDAPQGFGRRPRDGVEGALSGGSRIHGGGGPGQGRQGAGRFGLLNIAQPVANADEDLDGRVSQEEWTRAAARRFTALDKAQAGKLTLEALRNPAPDKKKR